MVRFGVSPLEIWRQLIAPLQHEPVHAAATPIPKPVAVVTPKPSPVAVAPMPVVSPTPDPLAWLLVHKERAPKEVTLRTSEEFPAVVNGTVAGSVKVPAGTRVGLVEIRPQSLGVVFDGGGKWVPYDATDVLELVKLEMTKPNGISVPVPVETIQRVPILAFNRNPQSNSIFVTEFVHPGIILTKSNLHEIEEGVRSEREPWKSWFQQYDGDPSGVNVAGKFEEFGRNPDLHRGEFQSDMWQLYRMAMLWTAKKDRRAAEKGMEILRTYAHTHKRWSGVESGFMRGDFMNTLTAAEILRWTYPGWTEQDTADITRYFSEMWWENYIGTDNTGAGSQMWTANQGTISLKVAMAVAIFCDDHVRFNMCLNAFLTDSLTGLQNSLPNGEVGDTVRDSGHWTAEAIDNGWICQLAWVQGIDLFAQMNYRMIAIGEYLAQNELYCAAVSKDKPSFVPYGCSYDFYMQPAHFDDFRGQDFLSVIDTYARRKGIPAPYTHQLLEYLHYKPIYILDGSVDAQPFETTWSQPPPVPVSDLNSRDVGDSRGSASEFGGVWTVTSGSKKMEDGYHIVFLEAEGDWTFVARLVSVDSSAHGGNLIATERLEPPRQVHSTWIEAAMKGSCIRWCNGTHSYGWPWDMHYYDTPRLPFWLKLVRRGVLISSWQSVDGANWAPAGNIRFHDLTEKLFVGLASWNGRTTFDHVAFGSAPSSLPPAPADLEASAWNGKAELCWKPGANTVFCDVLRAEQKGGPYTTVASRLTSNQFTDMTVSRGVTYYYTISPAGYSGRGPNSAEVSVEGL